MFNSLSISLTDSPFAWTGWPLDGVGSALLVLLALAILFLLFLRPDLVLRGIFWVIAHTVYRMRITGRRHIPKTGPALMVCNHVSFIDALLLFTAQHRLVRFVVWAPYTKVPFLRILLRMARVIPIDSRSGPRAILKSLHAASDALANGDVVCIFAEGGITRTGFIMPFHRGLEVILKRTPVPVIPVCLDHVWGSIFSYKGGAVFVEMAPETPLSCGSRLWPANATDLNRCRNPAGNPALVSRTSRCTKQRQNSHPSPVCQDGCPASVPQLLYRSHQWRQSVSVWRGPRWDDPLGVEAPAYPR